MTLSAVLLAGGESRRMGRDKATMIFESEPLWRRQLATLQNVGAEKIFVSGRRDPAWRPNELEFVPDGDHSNGPWTGLAATLARMSTTHLLALAVDMPFMNGEYLNSLRDELSLERGVVPQIGARYEPLAAIYPRDVYVDLTRAPNVFGYSLQRLLEALVLRGTMSARRVAAEDECLFRNLNEPADVLSR